MPYSIVEYNAENEGYKCGYCHSPDTNYSHGMWAHSLSVGDYQDLIDRGWRRSGKYCYKPTMDLTCCPMYTIRCDALVFKPSKSQKRIIKRWNKFLSGQNAETEEKSVQRKMSTTSSDDGTHEPTSGDAFVESSKKPANIDLTSIVHDKESPGENLTTNVLDNEKAVAVGIVGNSKDDITKSKPFKEGIGADLNKGPCRKAKVLRLERKIEKLREKGVDTSAIALVKNSNVEKKIEDFLNELPDDSKQKLEVRLVRTTPPSPEWLASATQTHQVYAKYQMAIHEDSPDKCTENKFKNFLVESPLQEEYSETGPPCGYGSFHQQYWLEGELVAVGVIDILPKCVSSVYFFYDPQYMSLTFGTYGALRELAFTRHLQTVAPSLKYYYMGYYIHSCRKMRYKGQFTPSYLLCPETYKWFPLIECIPKIDTSPYSRLNPDLDDLDDNDCERKHLDDVPMLMGSTVIPYRYYKQKLSSRTVQLKTEELLEYGKLVGARPVKSLILVNQS